MIDMEKIVTTTREVIVREIRDESKEFKASVSGILEGFKIALTSMNDRLGKYGTRT